MKKILMATDLSARSDRALKRALVQARELGAELTVFHVVDDSLPESIALQHEEAAKAALQKQLQSLPMAKKTQISKEVVRGKDYADILRHAQKDGADLLVLGIHRHNVPELFQGTTAERVVRFGLLPVLVVKDAVTSAYRRAVVAADLSVHAQAAAIAAARLVPKGEVHLVHAAHRPFIAFLGSDTQNHLIREQREKVMAAFDQMIAAAQAELGAAAPRFKKVMQEGEVRCVIREQIASIKPDFLALGTHGRTWAANAVVGSVAEDLLADAPVDVLAVKAA
jgi:nucleotide-binding universal stress UspA family protein